MKILSSTSIAFWLCGQLLFVFQPLSGQVVSRHPQVGVTIHASLTNQGERPVSLSQLPNGNLVYNNLDGNIYEMVNGTGQLIMDVTDHHLSYVSHMEVKDSLMYLSGSVIQPGDTTMIGYVMKGNLSSGVWDTLAVSAPYYLGRGFNDHRFSSLLVSLDGQHIYVGSGSRTNSGEVHELAGVSGTVNLRGQAIRGKVLKLPTTESATIFLPVDSTGLYASGYIHADGIRHLFAMAWGTDDNLYGGSNSDRRDVSEAFYKIIAGEHYGFPWWIGGAQNPLQFPTYNPATDFMLPSGANNQGYYDTDPDFPQMPAGLNVIQPYKNIGPDGDKIRNTQTGNIEDASEQGKVVTTFTGHRSPTGLIFDREQILPAPFAGDGFMVCYQNGGNLLLNDGHDLLQLSLLDGDTLSARQIASGFLRPIDVMIRDSNLYVLDLGNSNGSGRAIYQITFEALSTGLPNELTANPFVQLYPNPASSVLRIEVQPGKSIQAIHLYNTSGTAYPAELQSGDFIDVSELPAQVYLLEVRLNDGSVALKKWVKTN